MKNSIDIIATLGPSTLKSVVLKNLKKDINFFRLNMSHLTLKQLEKNLKFLKKNNISNICIDTEGAQVRTVLVKKKFFKKKKLLKVTNSIKFSNRVSFYPSFKLNNIKKNTKIKIGFQGLEIKVIKNYKNYLKCVVTNPGYLESNKGVHFNCKIELNPLTDKDLKAIEIAKQFGVKKFALSFANCKQDVTYLRNLISSNDQIISKIETKLGFINRLGIAKLSDAILIDRGDLSRYIDISKIPLAQRIIHEDCKKIKKKVYVATNLLETMINFNEPTRAESNDIFSSLEMGCAGLVLAAETAIGKYPVECKNFLKKCIKVYLMKNKIVNNKNKFFN